MNKEDDRMSLVKLVRLIERKERTSLVMRVLLEGDGAEREKRRALWSERLGSVESTDVIAVEDERVRSRSRVWPEMCVGKVMCWVREKTSIRLRKGEEEGQLGWSTWMLKSPVIISSEGEVARSSRRVANSELKMDLEEAGGR